LSFKIILIQKSQISIFRKGLTLFEFENVFDLDLNLHFKFKSTAKIFQKYVHFLLAPQNHFRPTTPCSPPVLFSSSLILFVADPVSFLAQRASPLSFWTNSGPPPYRLPPSVIKPPPPPTPSVTAMPLVPRASGSRIASHTPSKSRPLHLPDSLFPLPI
jgi:hypothetical protein